MAWLVCLLSGVNSAIGVYVEDRSALTGVRHAQVANYKDVERELAEIDTKRSAFISVRSIGEVDALIAAALAQAIVVDDRRARHGWQGLGWMQCTDHAHFGSVQ